MALRLAFVVCGLFALACNAQVSKVTFVARPWGDSKPSQPRFNQVPTLPTDHTNPYWQERAFPFSNDESISDTTEKNPFNQRDPYFNQIDFSSSETTERSYWMPEVDKQTAPLFPFFKRKTTQKAFSYDDTSSEQRKMPEELTTSNSDKTTPLISFINERSTQKAVSFNERTSPKQRIPEKMMTSNSNLPFLAEDVTSQKTISSNQKMSLPVQITYPSNMTNGTLPSSTQLPRGPTTDENSITTEQQSNVTMKLTTPSPSVIAHYTLPTRSTPKAGEPYGCQKISSCVCETRNGDRMDLTPLASNNDTPRFKDVPDGGGRYLYSWNPCYPFLEYVCDNIAVGQLVKDPSLTRCYRLGEQETVDFQISSNRGLLLQYTAPAYNEQGIAMRVSNVILKCDPNVEADFTAEGESIPQSGIYYFTLRSRHACLRRSGGNSTTHPPTPVTVTRPTPTPDPVYSLKTVVDLMFVLTGVVIIGLVVLLMLLTAIMVKRSFSNNIKPQPSKTSLPLHEVCSSDQRPLWEKKA